MNIRNHLLSSVSFLYTLITTCGFRGYGDSITREFSQHVYVCFSTCILIEFRLFTRRDVWFYFKGYIKYNTIFTLSVLASHVCVIIYFNLMYRHIVRCVWWWVIQNWKLCQYFLYNVIWRTIFHLKN